MTTVPRSVMHGVDSSAPTPTLLSSMGARANMGHRIYDERRLCTFVRDTNLGKLIPEAGYLGFLYDFAIHGGAIGTVNLGHVPAGFVICNAAIHVITTFVTASADAGTLALHVEAANDIVTATAVSAGGNIWDAGHRLGIPDWATVADWKRTTVDRQLVLTIGGQVVTAGKMRVFLHGFQSTTW